MDFNKILTGVLSKTLKLDDGKLAEIIAGENATEETVTNAILNLDASRVAELKKTVDMEKFQEGYKKAKKEERTAFEEEIKGQFKLDSQATGLDLITAIVSANKGAASGKEITEDDVKRHKSYQDLVDSMNTKVKDVETTWQTKLADLENQHKKAGVTGNIKNKALGILDSLKPVLPKNANAATNLKNVFTSTFDGYEYEEQDGRTLILKDGKILEDKHGNRVQLDDFIKETAGSYFDFAENNGGGNGGNGSGAGAGAGGSGAGGGSTSFTKPSTLEELTAIVDNPEISTADKEKAIKEFETNN